MAFYSTPRFRESIAAEGFECLGGGLDWVMSDEERPFPKSGLVPGTAEHLLWVMNEIFAGITARESLVDLNKVVDRLKPQLVVSESSEFAGIVAAEAHSIPSVRVLTGARDWITYSGRDRMRSALGRLRGLQGLPPDVAGDAPFRCLTLRGMPRSFDGPDAEFPATSRFVQWHNWSQTAGIDKPRWSSGESAKVLVSLGTLVYRTPGILESIVRALDGKPLEVILACGPERIPESYGATRTVRVYQEIPQSTLVADCDVLITHGGFGSVREALTAGIPMVIIPVRGDCPYTASRCKQLGVAEIVDPKDCTPTNIGAAIDIVLQNPAYRRAAESFRRCINKQPGFSDALTWLEDLVGHQADEAVPFMTVSPTGVRQP